MSVDGKGEIHVQEQAPTVTRRDFLKITAGAAGTVATGGAILKGMEAIANMNKSIQGGYLFRDNEGKYHASNVPQIVQVGFEPSSEFRNKGKVTFRLGNPNEGAEEKDLYPNEIKTQYAVRMAGSGFKSNNKDYARFPVFNPNRNEPELVGLWFKLTDKDGNNVNPQGFLLKEGEKPYFVGANFVNVRSEVNPQQTPKK